MRRLSKLGFALKLLVCFSILTLAIQFWSRKNRSGRHGNSILTSTTTLWEEQEKGVTKILLVTYMRSGSNFLSEVIGSHPDSSLMIEPLFIFYLDATKDVFELTENDLTITSEKLNLFADLLDCKFAKWPNLMKFLELRTVLFRQFDIHYTGMCEKDTNSKLCYDVEYLTANCRKSTVRIVKETRLPVKHVPELLKKMPNLKVIYSVRDPRAIVKSRNSSPFRIFCTLDEQCRKWDKLCQSMLVDLDEACSIQKSFPDRFAFVRYEDLACQPFLISERIFKFLNLTFSRHTVEFLQSHTSGEPNVEMNLFETHRVSKNIPFKWQDDIHTKDFKKTEDACQSVLEKLGLPLSKDLQPGQLTCESWAKEFETKEPSLCPLTLQFV